MVSLNVGEEVTEFPRKENVGVSEPPASKEGNKQDFFVLQRTRKNFCSLLILNISFSLFLIVVIIPNLADERSSCLVCRRPGCSVTARVMML